MSTGNGGNPQAGGKTEESVPTENKNPFCDGENHKTGLIV